MCTVASGWNPVPKPGKFESLSVCSAGAIGVTLKADAVLRCPGNVAGQSAMFLLQSGVRFVGRHVLMQLK
jgi:hypothetical protein